MKRIIINGLWKKFYVGISEKRRILEKIICLISGREQKKVFWALRDISFIANERDIIGIVGKNGSGKTTLLRTISGIYQKDRGEIKINGKLVSLISLYDGLKIRLTMKENIFLCCSILGLTNREIKERFDDIVKFAELEKFVNTKLYQFSNGMFIRLSAAIGFYSLKKGGVLLIDEETAVGDKQFKEKCNDKLKEIIKNGSVVLFSSHDLDTLKKMCNRIIWMDRGRIKIDGGSEVLEKYALNSLSEKVE